MAARSSTRAWEIPWTEEPVGLQSMGLQRAGHDLAAEHTHTYAYIMRLTPQHCCRGRQGNPGPSSLGGGAGLGLSGSFPPLHSPAWGLCEEPRAKAPPGLKVPPQWRQWFPACPFSLPRHME